MVKKLIGLLAIVLLGGCFSPSTPKTEYDYLTNFKGEIYSSNQALKKYGDDVQHIDEEQSLIYVSDSIIYVKLPYTVIGFSTLDKKDYEGLVVKQQLYKIDSLSNITEKVYRNNAYLLISEKGHSTPNSNTTISLSIPDTTYFFYDCVKK